MIEYGSGSYDGNDLDNDDDDNDLVEDDADDDDDDDDIVLVSNSICFNKVAAAEVGPRASNRTGCTFANFLTAMMILSDYEGGGVCRIYG